MSDDIEALKDLGSPKLEDLLPELETKNAPASIINQVEEAIQELPDSDFSDHYGTTNPYSTDSDSSLGDMDSDTDPTNPNGTTNPDTNSSGTGGDSDGLNTGGLTAEKIDLALEDAFGKEPADMSADEAAAAIAAISSYEDVHDDEDDSAIDDYIADLLQELIDSHNVFLYRQYVKDTEREYVSLAAVSRCRKYTKFRLVEKDGLSTMTQIAGGSASYSFEVGTKGVIKNSGKEEKLDVKTVSQTDNSLYGSRLTLYPYISETSSGKYLYCTCAYIKDTEWAVLITPSTDKKIAQLLDMLDIYADEDF